VMKAKKKKKIVTSMGRWQRQEVIISPAPRISSLPTGTITGRSVVMQFPILKSSSRRSGEGVVLKSGSTKISDLLQGDDA